VTAREPDARFVWFGDGPLRERAARDARARGIEPRVRFAGFTAQVAELVAQLDLFVSTSRHEGLGTAVLEAQALGVPVIATDSGGVRDSIRDRDNGRIVTPDELAPAVLEAIASPELGRGWAAAALESVRSFTPGAMVERTVEEYAKVLAERAANAGG
jgi:glycosyltransferase involved in cell wall biosynthesis